MKTLWLTSAVLRSQVIGLAVAFLVGFSIPRPFGKSVLWDGGAINSLVEAPQSPTSAPALLQMAPVDLGVIPSGGRRETAVWLRNSSAESLTIESLVTTCHCLKANAVASEVAGHSAIPVIIAFDDSKDTGFVGALRIRISAVLRQRGKVALGHVTVEVVANDWLRETRASINYGNNFWALSFKRLTPAQPPVRLFNRRTFTLLA